MKECRREGGRDVRGREGEGGREGGRWREEDGGSKGGEMEGRALL